MRYTLSFEFYCLGVFQLKLAIIDDKKDICRVHWIDSILLLCYIILKSIAARTAALLCGTLVYSDAFGFNNLLLLAEYKERQPKGSANWTKHPSTTNELPSMDSIIC